MIVPSSLPTGPLVLPALDVWRLGDDGRILGIDSAWETPEGTATAHVDTIAGWLAGIRRAWRASPARSDLRWSLTHRWLPDGDAGYLALLSRGLDEIGGHWEGRRGRAGLAGLTLRLPGRLTLHLSSASALTLVPLAELRLDDGEPTAILAGLRRIVERVGVTGRCPLSLTGLSCRTYAATLRYPVVTPRHSGLLSFEQAAVTPPRVEATVGRWDEGTQYDIRGAYVAAMRDVLLPTSPRGMWVDHVLPGRVAIYRGVFTQPTGLPPLLWDEEAGAWAYAGRGTHTSEEVAALLEVGGTYEVERGYVYDRAARCLAPFASACWRLRQQLAGDPLLEPIAKQLPLRLYGYLLSHLRSRLVPMTVDLLEQDDIMLSLVSDEIAELSEEWDNPWRWPAWGAMVLAQNRLAVWRQMCAVARQEPPGRTVAVYVDSLTIVGATLVQGPDLGSLKEVASGRVSVLNPQDVRVGRWFRAGGIPRHALIAELLSDAHDAPQHAGWRTRATLLEVLREGLPAGSWQTRLGTLAPRVDRGAWKTSFDEHRRPYPPPEYVEELGVFVNPDGSEAHRREGPERMGGWLPPMEKAADD